ncbi:sensor histidine kinase [Streptomyces sp. WMMB303]|uniref:sensor histidine kinase n=1 Tax=Streptomyces sp. WMMB303 TaxID=3034154 RepID=UPI0023EB4394|nr:sensor histidine kinase [Streptomyces sp. WMMB303]MDF4253602.1 sensor histidine kinase [Streptomyces sp. WMMB303]
MTRRAPAGTGGTETRRQQRNRALMVAVWLVFLGGAVRDLWAGGHSRPAVAAAAAGLAAFLAAYVALVYRHTRTPFPPRTVHMLLAALFALALVLALTAGEPWLVLFVYVAVAAGATLPWRRAVPAVAACVTALALVGTDFGARPLWGGWTSFVIPCVLAGLALMSARKTVLTLRELREARAVVAELAANEERLRLARDLHDLLGHSLSLITLKSELAGRMLPERPEEAAAQVADIEQVSRQALVDVREAVGGYRRPTLAVELAGARTALDTAGVEAELPHRPPSVPLAPEREGALAWALREAVTNVVRHSGAARCTVSFQVPDAAGEPLRLTVTDDGKGPSGAAEGNGLSGLRERLALADGSLSTSAGLSGGFTLCAAVPSVP